MPSDARHFRDTYATRLDVDYEALEQCPACELMTYDDATRRFPGPGRPARLTYRPHHAGAVWRCAAHADIPHRVMRPWIADIPLYRLKYWLRGHAAFDLDTLRELLPRNHPEYRHVASS